MALTDRHHPGQARAVWPPEPGFFRLRLTRGGWEVPARIIHTTDDGWSAEIDGFSHPGHPDPALAEGVSDIWAYGTIVDEADYRWRLAVKQHAVTTDPDHPALNPNKRIEPMRLRPLSP